MIRSAVRSGIVSVGEFSLHFGERLRDARIAYRLYGDASGPVLVVLGGISAGRNITAPIGESNGWWQEFVGPGSAIDTRRFAVLGIDFIGGSGASTGPRSEAFPAVSTVDQANAIAAVLDELGITRTHAIVGSSYGGMVALAFGALHPSRVERLVVIGAAHEPHPMATALRSLQRRIIRLGLETDHVAEAVSIARGIAMTTYRTSVEFAQRFDSAPKQIESRFQFPVEAYLEHCGASYARAYSPWAFLCLSESIDLHSVDPRQIEVPVTLVSFTTDTLVPPWQMRALADQLGERATLIQLDSIYGHDAFLKEAEAVKNVLRSIFQEEQPQ